PLEAFALPRGGLPELVRQPAARFTLDATVGCGPEAYHYRIGVQIQPSSGSLTVQDEYLAKLAKSGRLRAEHPKHFASVKRSLRTLIPSIEDLNVDLDEKRGTLDIQVRQDDTDYSSRIISEGTPRVLALCAIAANPWAKGL